MEALIWVAEEALPAETRGLFDPDTPLPAEVELVPIAPDRLGGFLLGGATVGSVVFAAMFAASAAGDPGDGGPSRRYWLVMMALMAAFIAVLLGRTAVLRFVRHGEYVAGRTRDGLFLGPDALVYRTDGGAARVPWAEVEGAEVHVVPAGGDAHGVPMIVLVSEGGEPGRRLQLPGAYPLNAQQVVEKINARKARSAVD